MAEVMLGEFEQIVILAVRRLGDHAYGVSIGDEIARKTGRATSPGALYTTLTRLEEKGALKSRLGTPTADRGGRAKRFIKVTAAGLEAVTAAQRTYKLLLHGFPLPDLSHD